MANRYGSESYALEFRDLQATTLSIDRNGDYALLAGRKYLAVLSLDAPTNDKLLVRIPYGGKYEISNTQWCKGEDDAKNVAVASSQRCDIFELTDSAELRCATRLKGHTRVITDLDWSSLQSTLLATSSFDSFVHIWDIRIRNSSNADKPQFSLSALDGASQVRWNRHSQDILASCDGGHVKIWDLRKPNSPSEFIAAHASKINGLEWANSDTVITAAQDCTVKFSKLSAENPTKAKGPVLSLTAPVWRARAAPFGRGVVTQCVPILRRDSGLLSLWDWKRFASPIFTFQAYDIIEFAWRKTQNFDLLTWSRDQTLRIWTLPREIVQLCGGEDSANLPSIMNISNEEMNLDPEAGVELTEEESPPESPKAESPSTSKSKRISTSERRSRKSSSPSPLNRRDFLRTEFEKVQVEKPENISFDQVELDKGLLRFSWAMKPTESKVRGVTAGILASFPNGYPAAPPTFLVTNASNEVDKNHVVKQLRNVAQQCSKKHEQCLSQCVQLFSMIMKSVKTLEDIDSFFPTRGVSNVPFPRTSGARFCAVGMLVCFGRPSYLKRVKSNCDAGTPRSLSALGPYLSQVALENEDNRHRRTRRHEKKRAGLVTVFDVSPLLPFNRDLAGGYKHIVPNSTFRKSTFDKNSLMSTLHKKQHVANVWQACSIISGFAHPKKDFQMDSQQIEAIHMDLTDDEEETNNWLAYHPLGCELIHSLITHYAQYGDVQTAATVACLFTSQEHTHYYGGSDLNFHHYKSINGNKNGHRQTVPRLTVPKFWTKGVGSPYHTVHGSDTLHLHHGIIINPLTADSFFRQTRSNSWSDSLDDIKGIHSPVHENGVDVILHSYHNQSNGLQQTPSRGHGIIKENSVVSINGLFNNSNINRSIITSNGQGFLTNPSSAASYNNNIMISKPLINVSKGVVLDPSLNRVYDRYKKSYAEILYRWGLLQQRAEILKNLTDVSESNTTIRMGVNFSVHCKSCDQLIHGPYCVQCKRIVSICSICHIPVKGISTFCSACGHGGHAYHMLEWFKRRKTCPSGCNCNCIYENARTFQ